jgi:hypothetical protein
LIAPKPSLWVSFKTPAFLRREGRRKRKAGAKNEKAILIIALILKKVNRKFRKILRENRFSREKTRFFWIGRRKKTASSGKNNHSAAQKH